MPSPFPGMDPFLEHPDYFPDLHNSMIIFMKGALQRRLPRPYYAISESREYLTIAGREVIPDVQVRHRTSKSSGSQKGAAAAIAEPTAPVIVRVPRELHREWYLNVMHAPKGGKHRLVTSVEILSPSNKLPGSHGRKQYRRKQREVLQEGANLVELDLLRSGTHTTLVPLAFLQREVPEFDYHVCVHRYGRRDEFQVYAFMLETPLPTIEIPLLRGTPDVAINLQETFEEVCRNAEYDRTGAYEDQENTSPPLSPARLRWARALLRRQGLLPRNGQS